MAWSREARCPRTRKKHGHPMGEPQSKTDRPCLRHRQVVLTRSRVVVSYVDFVSTSPWISAYAYSLARPTRRIIPPSSLSLPPPTLYLNLRPPPASLCLCLCLAAALHAPNPAPTPSLPLSGTFLPSCLDSRPLALDRSASSTSHDGEAHPAQIPLVLLLPCPLLSQPNNPNPPKETRQHTPHTAQRSPDMARFSTWAAACARLRAVSCERSIAHALSVTGEAARQEQAEQEPEEREAEGAEQRHAAPHTLHGELKTLNMPSRAGTAC